MHTIVLGKFGSGKSRYGTELVAQELLTGERPIVTTLALNIAALNAYVQRRKPNRDCRTWQRVFVLDKHQMKHFWRYRGVESIGEYGQDPFVLGPCGDKSKERAPDPRWEAIHQGVLYLIDEAPVAFHARAFAQTGIEFSDYITQHRKLGDDVFSFARSSELLDKQFRLTADACYIMDNWYQKVIKGFTAPRKIVAKVYENCPPLPGEDPIKKIDLTIDPKGLASCYFTTKGIGIAGTGTADMGKIAKGLPWWFIFPLGLAAGLLAWFAISRAMHFGASRGSKAITISNVKSNATPALAAVVPALAPSTNTLKTSALIPQALPPPIPLFDHQPKLVTRTCRGWANVNGRLWIAADHATFAATNWTPHLDGIMADGVLWTRSTPEKTSSRATVGMLKDSHSY